MMKMIESIVDIKLLKKFKEDYPVPSYFSYVAHFTNIEDIFAVAGILGPDFIEYEGGIYLKENVYCDEKINLDKRFGNSKLELELYNNLFCVTGFFTYGGGDLLETPGFIDEFGSLLCKFWSQRLNQLYPDRCFEFKLEDDLFYEDGLCLTFFQKE